MTRRSLLSGLASVPILGFFGLQKVLRKDKAVILDKQGAVKSGVGADSQIVELKRKFVEIPDFAPIASNRYEFTFTPPRKATHAKVRTAHDPWRVIGIEYSHDEGKTWKTV